MSNSDEREELLALIRQMAIHAASKGLASEMKVFAEYFGHIRDIINSLVCVASALDAREYVEESINDYFLELEMDKFLEERSEQDRLAYEESIREEDYQDFEDEEQHWYDYYHEDRRVDCQEELEDEYYWDGYSWEDYPNHGPEEYW